MKTMMVAVACAMFINMEVASVPIDMVEETQPVGIGIRAKVSHNNVSAFKVTTYTSLKIRPP